MILAFIGISLSSVYRLPELDFRCRTFHRKDQAMHIKSCIVDLSYAENTSNGKAKQVYWP